VGGILTFLVVAAIPTQTDASVAGAIATVGSGLLAVWVTFTVVFMGARLVVLTRRARGDAWLRTGATALR